MTRIAVIGGGRIGEALIAGLIGAGHDGADVVVAEPVAARAAELTSKYGISAADVPDAARGAELVVIAVKPGDVDNVVSDISKVELERAELERAETETDVEQLLLCLAAGITTARLEAKLPAGYPVVRVMPNTPMLVGSGMSVIAAGRYAQQRHLDQVAELLRTVGRVATVAESQMDAVTAVSGSGPAYFFLVVEAMIDAGVSMGLSRDVAATLVTQTMVGSAAMLEQSTEGPVALRAGVTSPGGTTAAAIRELERAGVRSAFIEALHAARDRSVEMGA